MKKTMTVWPQNVFPSRPVGGEATTRCVTFDVALWDGDARPWTESMRPLAARVTIEPDWPELPDGAKWDGDDISYGSVTYRATGSRESRSVQVIGGYVALALIPSWVFRAFDERGLL